MKKITLALALPVLLISLVGCKQNNNKISVETKTTSVCSKKDYELDLKFINGVYEIPYLDGKGMCRLLNIPYTGEAYRTSFLNGIGRIKNMNNDAMAEFDIKNNTITFSNYNLFERSDKSPLGGDFDSDYKYETTKEEYSPNGDTKSVINLNDYNIQLYSRGNDFYVPFGTFQDLININNNLFYNGKGIYDYDALSYYDEKGNLTEIGQEIKTPTIEYTEALKNFNYYETCLSIDFHYGVRKDYNYTKKTDVVLEELGYKKQIMEGDAHAFETAMEKFFNTVITDHGHTGMGKNSESMYSDHPYSETSKTPLDEEAYRIGMKIAQERQVKDINYSRIPLYENPEGSPTGLVVTFNSFDDFNIDNNGQRILNDTTACAVVYQANEFIKTNPTVKTVILNLALNGGGSDTAEAFVESWLTGAMTQYVRNPYNNATSVNSYKFDIDLDGKIDANDTIAGKGIKVLVITSLFSYSNGNVLPGSVKGRENVTIIGGSTRGGSCNVIGRVTPIGDFYRISALTQITYANGASFEKGSAPDIDLGTTDADLEKYQDYQYLINTYVNK